MRRLTAMQDGRHHDDRFPAERSAEIEKPAHGGLELGARFAAPRGGTSAAWLNWSCHKRPIERAAIQRRLGFVIAKPAGEIAVAAQCIPCGARHRIGSGEVIRPTVNGYPVIINIVRAGEILLRRNADGRPHKVRTRRGLRRSDRPQTVGNDRGQCGAGCQQWIDVWVHGVPKEKPRTWRGYMLNLRLFA